MGLTYASLCEIGDRPINEDGVLCVTRGGDSCFAVADGLGAHGKGEQASRLVLATLEREFRGGEPGGVFLKRALDAAQVALLAARETRFELKTTVAALVLSDRRAVWAHIGDSRLYCFRRRRLKLRTLDHSVPQGLARMGAIREEDIARHPDRNKLLRAMGDCGEKAAYELSKEYRLRGNEAFLLCSDGFWERVPDAETAQALRGSPDAGAWLRSLRNLAEREPAGMDNYSAIAVMLRGGSDGANQM
jgi:serine/threonine protein phosphatase PrpC